MEGIGRPAGGGRHSAAPVRVSGHLAISTQVQTHIPSAPPAPTPLLGVYSAHDIFANDIGIRTGIAALW